MCSGFVFVQLYYNMVHGDYTSGIHSAQLTWTHLLPLRVGFMAPPFFGQSWHLGEMPSAQVRHSQLPSGTFRMP